MSTIEIFNSSRLTWARRRRGLTKTKLAVSLGVDLRSVSAYETGEFAPEADKLTRIARVLRFPENFFFGDDLEEPAFDTASFRSMSKMTASQRDTALGSGAIALLLNEWIEGRFDLPHADVPDLGRDGSPEGAAEAVRRAWGLGELPIKNMVHLLEAKGVRVYSLAIDAVEVDAFSMWRQDRPFVFLNTLKSAEHGRFDAAHELGHLVLHRHAAPNGQEAEQDANSFASAFLMPAASVRAHAPRFPTIDNLIRLKKIWGVSLAAITYRLHKLGLLTDWHYRKLYIEIASRGYRKTEPAGGPREVSQILQKVFAALREDGIGKHDIACALNVHAEDVDELVFGLALTGLNGSGRPPTPKRRPELTVVSSRE
ncbi:XRE family transcriptional regulator [Mesorhizobium sp. VK25A]|uniref:XRE family transcriptional regulator n=2 Tax=Mesorhizobium TaxID=68287 RepID=A0ABU5ADH0_9HYPH|nr:MULTISPECIES: XRE family transcriptional regulator [unclassified Mesorhizobium]TIU13810.1 MAG: ImmA/IrrE family metallo-endopeptidase [Mesorhizobium sp.]MDX8469792.1 XRE family transcriptional regulator [Mesorhizobium sp. VK23B]MDX8476131.1 XRE family transcriptional regulator [Mesorhizobium sp. VK23A]MDX8508384.1 XRE family transcriptional regulator [Mesorhizobium sp. VK22E]MDX8535335.1 XRE family transcriptional regulator [Mesorhizobium sp. VK25D]